MVSCSTQLLPVDLLVDLLDCGFGEENGGISDNQLLS